MSATRLRVETEVFEASDAELVRAAAAGDRRGFADLYRRHIAGARRVARAIAANDEDAADAAAEAFTRVFDAIVSGRAPPVEFRAYLVATTRNAAIDQLRRSERPAPYDDLSSGRRDSGELSEGGRVGGDRPTSGLGPGDRLAANEDSQLVAQAFQGLPARWQSILWLTEVEGVPAREAAGVLGLSANNVSQLAVRARARLRAQYLQAHVRNHAQPRCQRTVDHLGAYLAGTLADGRRARVEDHLRGCAACRERSAELEDLGGALRRSLVPAPILAGSLAWMRRSHGGARHATNAALTLSRSPTFRAMASLPASAVAPLAAAGGSVARMVPRVLASLLALVPVIGGTPSTDSGLTAVVAWPRPVASTVPTTRPQPVPPQAPAAPMVAPQPEAPAPLPLPVTTHASTTVAEARGATIDVFSPGASRPDFHLENLQPAGAPLVFVVIGQQDDRLQVRLPIRPNGSTGWVRRQDVTLTNHTYSIVIELGAHRITAFRGYEPFLSEPVAVGTSDTPTPGGDYYTKERVQPVDAAGRVFTDGPYGPWAFGLSGFSEVLFEFAGGDGVIGIHGTNDPSALGSDVSHGCIRMSNEGITTLAQTLPLGVPVEIRA